MTKIEWAGLLKRFISYIDVHSFSQCWNWKGGLFTNGYGQFRAYNKKVKAHRFAFEIFVDEIPNNMFICNKCDIHTEINRIEFEYI